MCRFSKGWKKMQKKFQPLELFALVFPILGTFFGGLPRVWADEGSVVSFQAGGLLGFSGVTHAAYYQVDWSTNLGAALWNSNAPGLSFVLPVPAGGRQVVTVGVAQAHCFYRVLAIVTNPPVPHTGLVEIPGGSFVMGAATNVLTESYVNERPQHTVTVGAFYMATTEVAKAEWDETATWAAGHGYTLNAELAPGKASNHPVHTVTWENAVKWCNAKSERAYRTPCYTNQDGSVYRSGDFTGGCNWSANGYRLPTEAEWERAARGGSADHRFSWTDDEDIQHSRANYYSDSSFFYDKGPGGYHPLYNFGEPKTAPVGVFAANGYGLSEMIGNVREWCGDFYAEDYYTSSPVDNPRGPATGTERVLRGGGWNSYASACRVAWRASKAANSSDYDLGFRLACGTP